MTGGIYHMQVKGSGLCRVLKAGPWVMQALLAEGLS